MLFMKIVFMILCAGIIGGLWEERCYGAQQAESNAPALQDNNLNAAAPYLEKHVIGCQNPAEGFQERIGDPLKAKRVLLFFTALRCPMCAHLHQKVIPDLTAFPEFKKGEFAIIIRDYPTDVPSLKAACLAWRIPERSALLRQKFFANQHEADSWAMPWEEESSLRKLLKIAQKAGLKWEELKLLAGEMKAVRADPGGEPVKSELIKQIFDKRLEDKEALGINEVPTIFLITKTGNTSASWKVEALAHSFDVRSLLDALGIASSPKEPQKSPEPASPKAGH